MLRGDLLLTLAEELDDLGASAMSLQATLGGLLERADATDGGHDVWHLQEIDRLQQTLEDLSAILRRAANEDGTRVNVEDLAAVARLGALRERIRGRSAPVGDEPGALALF